MVCGLSASAYTVKICGEPFGTSGANASTCTGPATVVKVIKV